MFTIDVICLIQIHLQKYLYNLNVQHMAETNLYLKKCNSILNRGTGMSAFSAFPQLRLHYRKYMTCATALDRVRFQKQKYIEALSILAVMS